MKSLLLDKRPNGAEGNKRNFKKGKGAQGRVWSLPVEVEEGDIVAAEADPGIPCSFTTGYSRLHTSRPN
jgi:hypothetical protein